MAAEDFLSIVIPHRPAPSKTGSPGSGETEPNLAVFKQSSALKLDHADYSQCKKNVLKHNGEEYDRTCSEEIQAKRLKMEELPSWLKDIEINIRKTESWHFFCGFQIPLFVYGLSNCY